PLAPGTPAPNVPGLNDLLSGSTGIVKTTGDKATAILQLLPSGNPANVIVNEALAANVLQTLSIDVAVGNHANMVRQMNELRATQFGRIGHNELINALPR